MKTIAASEVPVAVALVVAEPEHEQRHDHPAAADAEQPAEEPGGGADDGERQRPCARRPAARRRACYDARYACPRRDARRGARAAPRRSRPAAPSCSTSTARSRRSSATPTDAHVPEATRTLLIEIAKRYGLVGCVSGPPRGHRAPDRRRSARSPTSATTAASCCARGATSPSSTPRSPPGRGASAPSRRAPGATSCSRLRVRGEDKDAIAAFHWRGAPDEDAAERAVREIAERAEADGLRHPLGPQGARGPPAGAPRQGPRRRAPAARTPASTRRCTSGDDTDRPRRLRGLRALVGRRPAGLGAVRRRALRRDPAGARAREADLLVDGPRGVRELLEALL